MARRYCRCGRAPRLDFLPPWWYVLGMRVKTSVSLSTEILKEVSNFTTGGERSDFIEKALWNYIQFLHRCQRNQQDLDKINKSAEFLNSEALDSLSFQVAL
jgi:hypothetical protein